MSELLKLHPDLLTVECECRQRGGGYCGRCFVIVGESPLNGRRAKTLDELLVGLPPEWALINDFGPDEEGRNEEGKWVAGPSYVCDLLVGEGKSLKVARGNSPWEAVARLLIRLEAEKA